MRPRRAASYKRAAIRSTPDRTRAWVRRRSPRSLPSSGERCGFQAACLATTRRPVALRRRQVRRPPPPTPEDASALALDKSVSGAWTRVDPVTTSSASSPGAADVARLAAPETVSASAPTRAGRVVSGLPRLRGHPLDTCRGATPRRTQPLLALTSLWEKIYAEADVALTKFRPLSGRYVVIFEAKCHGPYLRVPTLRRLRYRNRRKAHYRPGRAHP